MMTIYFPGKLVFGNGVIEGLVEEVLRLSPQRVFVVTIDPFGGEAECCGPEDAIGIYKSAYE